MLAESRRRVARDPVLRLDVGSGQERYRHVSPALVETGLGGSRNGRDATPLAIEDSMVSSLDVQPTREDPWDRFVIVRGFWDWRIIGSSDWNAKRMVGWG